MKASFTMIPAESKRLIAKAVVEREDIKIAKQTATSSSTVEQRIAT